MAALGMLDPDVEPRVSSHLEPIIALIARLVERGLAYAAEGDVYYRVAAFADYGKLGKRKPEELLEGAGSRVEVDARKESPLDFALWKAAKPGEPAWDSPWGAGRPGWHIECSAMCGTHLGETFDLHFGGRDLIFPHHENEIAQSQGAFGPGTFAQYWLHNGFIDFAGEKMSKSLGNFFTTREVLALHDAETVRYFLLTVHYRSGLNFDVRVDCPDCGAELDREAQERGKCAACGAEPGRDALARGACASRAWRRRTNAWPTSMRRWTGRAECCARRAPPRRRCRPGRVRCCRRSASTCATTSTPAARWAP